LKVPDHLQELVGCGVQDNDEPEAAVGKAARETIVELAWVDDALVLVGLDGFAGPQASASTSGRGHWDHRIAGDIAWRRGIPIPPC
jgi:hypothetical protein